MRRRRAAAAAAVLAAASLACGALSTEEQLLAEFFRAARLRDSTRVARVADVDFDPRAEGVVERFWVTEALPSREAGERVLRLDARVRRAGGSIQARELTATLRRDSSGRWRVASLAG